METMRGNSRLWPEMARQQSTRFPSENIKLFQPWMSQWYGTPIHVISLSKVIKLTNMGRVAAGGDPRAAAAPPGHCIPHPTPHTPHPTPHTLNPTPQTPHPKPRQVTSPDRQSSLLTTYWPKSTLSHAGHKPRQTEFFVDNLLVRMHLIIEMILVDRPCAMGV